MLCVALHPVRAIANIPIKIMRLPTVITVLMTVICDLLMNGLHCLLASNVLPGFFATKLLVLFVEFFCHWGKLLK